jgi:hypothetical protein
MKDLAAGGNTDTPLKDRNYSMNSNDEGSGRKNSEI